MSNLKKNKRSNPWSKYSRYAPWIIGLLCLINYSNALFNGFALDDSIVITENVFTKKGIAGWQGILTKDTFYGFFQKEGKDQLVAGGRYRPMSLLIFSLIYELFGENPFVYHALNLLLFNALSILIYFWLYRMFREFEWSLPVGLATSVIFASHPIHTEVVANIKGLDEILAMLFAVCSAYILLHAKDNKGNVVLAQVTAGILFFLGLLSKENTITYLAVIPISFYFFRSRNIRVILWSLPGILVASISFIAVRASILGKGLGEPPMELMNNPFLKWTGNQYVIMHMGEKFSMIFQTLFKYLQLFIFPHPLSHDYYPKVIEPLGFGSPVVLLSISIYIALVAAVVYFWRKIPLVSFALLAFFAPLSIVSNFFFPVGTNMSERFLFMPSLGLCLLISYLTYRALSRKKNLYLGIHLLAVVLFTMKTINRNPVWKNNYTLFTTDVEVSENSAKLQNATGGVLIDESVGKPKEERNKMLQRAIVHLEKAKEIHPTYKSPNLLLGNANFYLEDYLKAQRFFQLALDQDPDFIDAKLNMAICKRKLNDFEEALSDMKKLIDEPRLGQKARQQLLTTYEEAGKYAGQQGNIDASIDYFQKGLKEGGNPAKFNYFIGVSYAQKGQLQKALDFLQEAKKHPMEDDNNQNVDRALNQVMIDLKKEQRG
jgi:tetratricopeptide (TPR) repeat protein